MWHYFNLLPLAISSQIFPTINYGGPQLSRQKQIVSPQKQIASRQKQTGYGKSKLEMAKANLLRQKQIRNGKSKFVTAKANWKWQQPVGKSRNKLASHGKSKLYAEEVANSWRTPKSFRTKAKIDQQNQRVKCFDRKSKKQKAYEKSKLVISLQLITSQKQTHSSQIKKQMTFASRKSNNSYLEVLPLDPFRRAGCKIARHCRMESVRYWYSSVK